MRQRCEALDMSVKWKGRMEKQIGRKIKELQIGNVGRDMNQFYDLARTPVFVLTSQKVYMGWLRK